MVGNVSGIEIDDINIGGSPGEEYEQMQGCKKAPGHVSREKRGT